MTERDQLIGIMNRYLEAMTAAGAPARRVSEAIKVTENGVAVPFGEGLLRSVQSIGFRQCFVDATNRQAGCFGTLQTTDGTPLMLALRIKSEGGLITESEAIVARKGGHRLFAPEQLVEPLPIYDTLLSPADRSSRDEMQAIANLYFDGIEQANGAIPPFHPDCNRRENGVYTTNNPARGFALGCRKGLDAITWIPRVRERRFPVVDEERGLIWAIVMFDMPTQDRSMRLAELFKIVAGQIREIEAVMINTPLHAGSGWGS